MSPDSVNDLIARARETSAQRPESAEAAAAQRDKLAHIAAEFESMLLGQMLRDMRAAGKWDDEGGEDGEGRQEFGALFETIDSELVKTLTQSGGLGLGKELLKSLERNFEGASPMAEIQGRLKTGPVQAVPTGTVAAPAKGAVAAPAVDVASPTLGIVPSQPAFAPVKLEGVTSEFGWRRDPINGHTKFHRGVDFRAAYGEEVRSAADGRIAFEGVQRGYGTTVVVEHANGVRTRYAHLSAAQVQEGDPVVAGQVIGRAGRSGRATGTHLHFEVTANGRHVDPASWLAGQQLKPEAHVADSRVGATGFPGSLGDRHEN